MTELRRLPKPLMEVWEWQLVGACRAYDSELFFHPEHERGPARTERDAAAKRVCSACPVLLECRAHALSVREPYGIWGGLSADDREAVLRDRNRLSRDPRHEPAAPATAAPAPVPEPSGSPR